MLFLDEIEIKVWRPKAADPLAERLGVTEVQSPGGQRVSVIRA